MHVQGRWTTISMMAATVAVVAVLQLQLILNPGYFSHDELQWAAFAADGVPVAPLWTNLQAFQYRPLTFSLWMWLSNLLFDHPRAFHAVLVLWGGLNAALLACLAVRLGASRRAGFAAAVVFAMSAFAVQTHGWVGTIGDLVWVSCALLTGLLATACTSGWRLFAGAAALTAIGLLAKESAVVIPALTALGWLLLGRERRWAWATAGACAPVLAYLSLRLGVILFSPREAANYGWSLSFIPLRWLEYQLFAPLVSRKGITQLLPAGFSVPQVWLAAALWIGLAWTFWKAGPRWLAAFLLLGFAALGPVLILTESANQYGYGYAAAIAALGAASWSRVGRAGRVVLVLCALLSVWHGVNVMRRMHEVGVIQSRFSPSLAQGIDASSRFPVRVRPVDEGQRWIYLRLSHAIPHYHGVPIGDRVQLVAADAPADYVIAKDGALAPAR